MKEFKCHIRSHGIHAGQSIMKQFDSRPIVTNTRVYTIRPHKLMGRLCDGRRSRNYSLRPSASACTSLTLPVATELRCWALKKGLNSSKSIRNGRIRWLQ